MGVFRHQLCLLLYAAVVVILAAGFPQKSPKMSDDDYEPIEPMNLDYSINLTWDGKPLDHSTKINLLYEDEHVVLTINAPFYNDPAPPDGKPGEPYYGLWNYEVVEAFFLNDQNQYLESEFGPHGQHLLLFLNGERNDIKHCLPLDYEATILEEVNLWVGVARIPLSYFPPNITKFNAYAIHGPEDDRKYEALYEVSGPEPDFHRLDKFGDFPFTLQPQLSDIWKDAIDQSTVQERVPALEYKVGLSWDGKETVKDPAIISLYPRENDLELSISAPFYDDPAPPGGQPGQAYFKLWDYEVVEAFFLNDNEDYLELEFGPHSQHLMLLLSGRRNAIKHSLPLDYTAKIDRDNKRWTGTAFIPGSYFPPNVTKFNGYAIHGTGDDRKYEAVFESSGPQPDFHRLEKFQPIDLSFLLNNNRSKHSDTWEQALLEHKMQ